MGPRLAALLVLFFLRGPRALFGVPRVLRRCEPSGGPSSPLMVRADNGRTPTAETHSGGPKHGYMTNGERAGFATKPCFKLVNGIAHADGTRPRRMTGTFWDVLPAKAYGNELFCTMPLGHDARTPTISGLSGPILTESTQGGVIGDGTPNRRKTAPPSYQKTP